MRPHRVLAVVSVSGLAPYGADGLDWFAGMALGGQASLRAGADGRTAKERHEASATDDDPGFIAADEQALTGACSWFLDVVRPALALGPGGLIDDDPMRCIGCGSRRPSRRAAADAGVITRR